MPLQTFIAVLRIPKSAGRTVEFFSARLSTKSSYPLKLLSLESSKAKCGEIMVKKKVVIFLLC
jgi:hypothetical protein